MRNAILSVGNKLQNNMFYFKCNYFQLLLGYTSFCPSKTDTYTTGILKNHIQICKVQSTYNSYLPYNYGAIVFLFIDTHEVSYFLSAVSNI